MWYLGLTLADIAGVDCLLTIWQLVIGFSMLLFYFISPVDVAFEAKVEVLV